MKLSVVIPAYNSHHTIHKCLETILDQAIDEFEIVVIDSGPSPKGAQIISEHFPAVRLKRSNERLLPHAARNLGARIATADKIVFTDPDVYASPGWLATLVEAHHRYGGVVVGSVLCHGNRWIDRGAHLAKFDLWLPGGQPRSVSIAPTVNMVISRGILDELEGFPGEYMIGDTVFSWKVAASGYPITFQPKALLEHHHVSTWKGLLIERYQRSQEFAMARSASEDWNQTRIVWQLVISLVPLRWANLVLRTFHTSRQAGLLGDFFLTLPIVLTAHAAWIAGEVRAHITVLATHEQE